MYFPYIMSMEHWRDIKGFEGLYQVSNLGQVKSLNYNRTGKEQVLVGLKTKVGYPMVGLCKDGKVKLCLVHRLVAEAFIPNPDGLPCVNHKDECKTNNVVSNLEWCTRSYNNNYGTRTERAAKVRMNDPNRSKPVYQYTLDGLLVRSYPSVNEVRRRTGYDNGHISECCLGKRKTAYNSLWSYSLIVPRGKLF